LRQNGHEATPSQLSALIDSIGERYWNASLSFLNMHLEVRHGNKWRGVSSHFLNIYDIYLILSKS